jgi:hypothetical protein
MDSVPFTVDGSLYRVGDHLGGFDTNFQNNFISSLPVTPIKVHSEYFINDTIQKNYPHIEFNLDYSAKKLVLNSFADYRTHPDIIYKNFVCSFNGSSHVGRKLLVSILERFGYFNPEYCSKNFIFSVDELDGHIVDYSDTHDKFYRKFFIANNSDSFFGTAINFKDPVGHLWQTSTNRTNHQKNIYNLESYLTGSFLHVVSETLPTSYYPFVTEKFLYSVVTRGLFVAYAQPGWHEHVEKYYGFKKYTKLFNYQFDNITHPLDRLIELMTMISKFSKFSTQDWHDLYLLEQDTIEFNYDHYFSGNYLQRLRQQ